MYPFLIYFMLGDPFSTFGVCKLRLKSCYELLSFYKLLNQSYIQKFIPSQGDKKLMFAEFQA